MNERQCKSCGLIKPLDKFATAGRTNKGETYRRHHCKPCYNQLKKKQGQKRLEWLDEYKKTLHCEHCGLKDHRTFEFHHASGDKEFNIADGKRFAYGKAKMMAEINKCQVLCANCHRVLHHEERNGKIEGPAEPMTWRASARNWCKKLTPEQARAAGSGFINISCRQLVKLGLLDREAPHTREASREAMRRWWEEKQEELQ